MKTIRLIDYPELNSLAWDFAAKNKIGKVQSNVSFLRSIGYKSAEWVPGTFQYLLSDEEYTWFVLRWS